MEFIEYQEALNQVLNNAYRPVEELVPFESSYGRFLSKDLKADRDFPPFDRVMMDGVAIAFSALNDGQNSFPIEATAAAGQTVLTSSSADKCIEVMTGAILPRGLDTVIPYEHFEIVDNVVSISKEQDILENQNVHKQGTDKRFGEVVIPKGTKVSAASIALVASLGYSKVPVLSQPKIVVISTGDELVNVDDTPKQHQIRKSNIYSIGSYLKSQNISCDYKHLEDDKDRVSEGLAECMEEYDCLILSGGVSKGKYDFVPGVLEELGVQKHFHRVKQRPGKPFWFGSKGEKVVFAFPGNPVSSFMCAHVYLHAWLLKSFNSPRKNISVITDEEIIFKPDLTYFLQAKMHFDSGVARAQPVNHHGSGDFANLIEANGFLVLPRGKTIFPAGEVLTFIPF